jgi:Ca2+-binding RTX toxin-like protein
VIDDIAFGAAGRDEFHGGFGDDILEGGDGDDVLYGDVGSDMLAGGSGDDWISSGGGSTTIATGTGEDTAVFAFRITDGLVNSPSVGAQSVDDVITDFTPGQDKLSISWDDDWEYVDDDPMPIHLHLTFTQLDSNGDGRIDGADQGIDISNVTFEEETKPSLVIDVGDLDHIDTRIFSTGTITLFGVTRLEAGDLG